jgi:hypothetical protein
MIRWIMEMMKMIEIKVFFFLFFSYAFIGSLSFFLLGCTTKRQLF